MPMYTFDAGSIVSQGTDPEAAWNAFLSQPYNFLPHYCTADEIGYQEVDEETLAPIGPKICSHQRDPIQPTDAIFQTVSEEEALCFFVLSGEDLRRFRQLAKNLDPSGDPTSCFSKIMTLAEEKV